MRIKIKLHPNSSREKIEKIGDDFYEVWLSAKPVNGKANATLEKFLKKEFGGKARIVSGFTSRIKSVEVAG